MWWELEVINLLLDSFGGKRVLFGTVPMSLSQIPINYLSIKGIDSFRF